MSPEGAPTPAELSPPWSLRRAEPEGEDSTLVSKWMSQPHVERWWRQAWPPERWASEWRAQEAADAALPALISREDEPVGYVELYRVRKDVLARHYDSRACDLGIHIALGDAERVGRGWGRAVLRELAEALLRSEPACGRVVAEPDVRNLASVKAFTAAGFRTSGVLELEDKTAVLCVYPRTERDLP